MPENLFVAVRFAFDLFLKATLLLAMTVTALFLLRRASAAVRQLVATLGLAGVLALPAVSLFAPRWEIPLIPNPVPLAVPAVSELTAPRAEARPTSRSDWPATSEAAADTEPSLRPPDVVSSRSNLASTSTAKDFEPDGATPKTSSSPTWWMFGALALWAAGALLASARLVLGTNRVAAIRRRASEVDENWTAVSNELGAKLGVARPVRLLFSRDVAVPVTAGLRRPVVLLPDTARRWNEERRRVVLLHELAHVRRCDWMALLVGQAAVALYWFHPLAWSIRVQMRKDCERACDDLVLAAGTRASVYAAHLLSIIRSLRLSRQRALPAVAMAHRSYWDGRMRAILDPAVARRAVSGREARLAAAAIFTAVAALAVFEPWAPACAAANGSHHVRPAVARSVSGKAAGPHADSECPIKREKKAKRASLVANVVGEVAANVAGEVAANVIDEVATATATSQDEGFTKAGWKQHKS